MGLNDKKYDNETESFLTGKVHFHTQILSTLLENKQLAKTNNFSLKSQNAYYNVEIIFPRPLSV